MQAKDDLNKQGKAFSSRLVATEHDIKLNMVPFSILVDLGRSLIVQRYVVQFPCPAFSQALTRRGLVCRPLLGR